MNEPSSLISLNNRDLPHQDHLFSLFWWILNYLSDFHPDDFEDAQNILVQSVTAGKLQNILPDFCTSLINWREIARRSNWTVNIVYIPNRIFADDQKMQVMGKERIALWNEIFCRNRECRPPSVWQEMWTPLCW